MLSKNRVDKIIEDIEEISLEQIVLINSAVYDACTKIYKKENYQLLKGIVENCPFLQACGSAKFIKNLAS